MRAKILKANLKNEDHLAYIQDTFIRSYITQKGYDNKSYKHNADKLRSKLPSLWNEYIPFLIVDSINEDLFLGWVAFRDNKILYIYIKKEYRKRGIGKGIISKITDKPIFQLNTLSLKYFCPKVNGLVDDL